MDRTIAIHNWKNLGKNQLTNTIWNREIEKEESKKWMVWRFRNRAHMVRAIHLANKGKCKMKCCPSQ